MKTEQAPLVIDGLSDPALPAAMNIPRIRTEMPGSEWLDWLESHNRFKFENPDGGKFTAYKSSKGYWTAQRRIHGKLRHDYLGASSNLTYETLNQIARKMDMRDSAYWREKYPDPRAVHKPNVESHKKNYETVSETSSQTATEIEDLKRQVAELELKLSSTERQFKQKEQKLNDAEKQISELKAICKRINLDCKVYKLHKHEVVRLEDLTKLGYELQRNLLNCD
jgi:hypothetical protein